MRVECEVAILSEHLTRPPICHISHCVVFGNVPLTSFGMKRPVFFSQVQQHGAALEDRKRAKAAAQWLSANRATIGAGIRPKKIERFWNSGLNWSPRPIAMGMA